MRSRFRWLGSALLVVAAILAVLLFVVFRVAGPPRWPEGTIFVPRDAETIQAALASSSPGATIVLQTRAGTFRGPVVIDRANVTIAAAGDGVRLAGSGSEPALTIRADGVTVKGIEIASESIGIRIESAQCTIEDVHVIGAPIGVQLTGARGCTLDRIEVEGGSVGLELVSSGGNALTDITVRGAAELGLKGLDARSNRLDSVVVVDTPTGFSFEQGSAENELLECRVERASVAGIEFHGSNDNLLVEGEITDVAIGVVLASVTGNEIRGCSIDGVGTSGIYIQQSIQNRIEENAIANSQSVGIDLSQSAENALFYNRVDACTEAGIRLGASDRNLILGNSLTANTIGIDADGSSYGRILRNAILSVGSSEMGIGFIGGEGNRLLDNRVTGGELGILLRNSSENTLLRNRVEGQAGVGLGLVSAPSTRVIENRVSDCVVGVALSDSSRSEVVNNLVASNEHGMILASAGQGIRIEGNTFEENGVGFRQAVALDAPGLELQPDESGEIASPVVANNRFLGSDLYDVENETEAPVFVGGNWWGSAAKGQDASLAVVSGNVDLEGSAWRGTLALGTEAETSQEILGRILQIALSELGFRVIDLVGMGDSDRVRSALRAEDVDFVWWGTDASVFTEDPADGLEITTIPAARRWTVVVSGEAAEQLAEASLSAFAARVLETGEAFRYAVPRSVEADVATSFEVGYGLRESVGSVSRTESLGETEALLKFGAVEAAIVDNLEETLTFSGFVALEDDLRVFEVTPLLVASRSGLFERFPDVERVLAELATSLTTSVVHDLISRVRLLQHEPEAIAREYLEGLGLLAE